MSCHDCGKELKGGFGIGKRPFKKFLCADCIMRRNENERGIWALGKIKIVLDKPMPAYPLRERRKQLESQMSEIRTFVELCYE